MNPSELGVKVTDPVLVPATHYYEAPLFDKTTALSR